MGACYNFLGLMAPPCIPPVIINSFDGGDGRGVVVERDDGDEGDGREGEEEGEAGEEAPPEPQVEQGVLAPAQEAALHLRGQRQRVHQVHHHSSNQSFQHTLQCKPYNAVTPFNYQAQYSKGTLKPPHEIKEPRGHFGAAIRIF